MQYFCPLEKMQRFREEKTHWGYSVRVVRDIFTTISSLLVKCLSNENLFYGNYKVLVGSLVKKKRQPQIFYLSMGELEMKMLRVVRDAEKVKFLKI